MAEKQVLKATKCFHANGIQGERKDQTQTANAPELINLFHILHCTTVKANLLGTYKAVTNYTKKTAYVFIVLGLGLISKAVEINFFL